ncbi:TPA: hypothetical protein ACIAVU_003703, partial [Salmonella enterica subsp. enterica serovar Virchow]
SQSVIRLRFTFFSCKFETLILLFIIIYNNNPALLPYFSKEKNHGSCSERFTSPSHFYGAFRYDGIDAGDGSWPLSVYAHAAGNAGGKAANV